MPRRDGLGRGGWWDLYSVGVPLTAWHEILAQQGKEGFLELRERRVHPRLALVALGLIRHREQAEE